MSFRLRMAVAAALAAHGAKAEPVPELPEPAPELSKLTVVPVRPGHPKEPSPKGFTIEGQTCYVRAVDWPALKRALAKNRAKAQGGP